MSICVNIERMYAVVFPLKTVGWRRYMLPVCLTVAVGYNIPKVSTTDRSPAFVIYSLSLTLRVLSLYLLNLA